jgi:uncharacterized phage protein gp47/JayE
MADNVVNILDFNNFIRQFMREQIRKTQPDMDTSENSSFDDIFVKPMIASVDQLMQAVSLIEYRTNLKYADMLTDDQVKDIGENNYAVTRKSGNAASAVQVFKFNNVGKDGITIPAGVVITSNDGYEFYTRTESYFPSEDVISNYNPASGQYEISVIIYAANTGSEYNKGANTINTCQTQFSPYLVSTTNPSAATGGTDAESISDYVERMRTYYATQHLGSKPGYESFVSNAFPNLSDVVVIGYGDEAMKRDIIRYIPSSYVKDDTLVEGWKEHEKHIGGCVDIYVRGSEYKLVETAVASMSRYILISGKITEATAKGTGGTKYNNAEDDNVIFIYINENGEILQGVDGNGEEIYEAWDNANSNTVELFKNKTILIIGNDDTNFKDDPLVDIEVEYADGGRKETKRYLINPSATTNVPSPISQKVVSAIYSNASGEIWDEAVYESWKGLIAPLSTTSAHEDCEIVRKTISGADIDENNELDRYYIGSTQEQASVVLSPYFPNTCEQDSDGNTISTDSVAVTTSFNVTLNSAASLLNMVGNKIVTGDVLVKEAESIKVSVGVEVKLSDSDTLSELRKSQIHSVVSALFSSTPIGGTIEQSDIVGELYSNSDTKNYIKYIRVPLKKFYCDGNNVIAVSTEVGVSDDKTLSLIENVGAFELDKDGNIVGLSVVDKASGNIIAPQKVDIDEGSKIATIKLPDTISDEITQCIVKYHALYEKSLYESGDNQVAMPDYISAAEDKYLVLDEFSVNVI